MTDQSSNILLYENSVDMEKVKSRRSFIYKAIKRLFDLFGATIGLIAMVIIVIPVKIMYIITGDFKSVFYTHTRVGKDGVPFLMYKFRTMVPNSKEILEELLKDPKYKEEWDKNQKLENDPRVTKAGKILRKTSLDELPQMINVLLGHMSLIGPRPLIPGELDKHNGNHEIYERIRPGVTSWWASHGRSATTYEERLALEYYYVQNRSLWLDIKCIFATIKAVISKTGAK